MYNNKIRNCGLLIYRTVQCKWSAQTMWPGPKASIIRKDTRFLSSPDPPDPIVSPPPSPSRWVPAGSFLRGNTIGA